MFSRGAVVRIDSDDVDRAATSIDGEIDNSELTLWNCVECVAEPLNSYDV